MKQTTNQKTGGQGEALVAKVVADMGFLWRPSHPDFGVDGEIEVVDREGNVTGRRLLVQVKATVSRLPGENEQGFSYAFKKEHVEYWAQCSLPVIVVVVNVPAQVAWWMRVDTLFAEPRMRTKRTVRFDKERDRFGMESAERLAAAATPSDAPLALLGGTETLVSNLLEVRAFAPVIYSAVSKCEDRASAWARMKQQGAFAGDFHLDGRRVYSFTDLASGPLVALCDGPVTSFSTGEWAEATDHDVVYRFTALLNFTLRAMHHPELVFHTKKKIVYYGATPDLTARKIKGTKGAGRTFFAPHQSRDDINKVSFYKHYAADLRFQRWDELWYLAITPTYHYTRDGHIDSRFDSEYLAGMKRLERNRAVHDLVRAWAAYLKRTEESTLFSEADQRILFGELVQVELDAAIDEKVWLAQPPNMDDEPSWADGEGVA